MKKTIVIGLLLRAAWADPLVQERGSHRLFHDPQAASNHLLLLSLGGTNSRPADLASLDRLAAQMGYHVVALDYPNSVISTACRESPQPDAFERFRQEIVAGAPVSDLVQVDRANSIEGRLTGLLGGLQGSWREFYDAGQPVWEKMVAIGHSQGSGHAAYLGKQHRLRGVIMLAGPQDTGAAGPAPWLSRPGATPGPCYQALLHKEDTFGCANN